MRTHCSRCTEEYDGVTGHGPGHCEERSKRTQRRSKALLDIPPSLEIATLETAADSLMRLGDPGNAVALWAMALKMRAEVVSNEP